MIQLNPERFVNAAAKARQVKLYVRMFAWRQYGCRTPQGHVYTVRFETKAGGTYARCNCAAGAKLLPCYHVAAVFPVDTAVVRMRQEHVAQLERLHEANRTSPPFFNCPLCIEPPGLPPVLVKPQPPSMGRVGGIEL
jgi:hypothetical protein